MRHLLAAAATIALLSPIAGHAADAPLIERAKLFGNPSRTLGKISPDGKWLSWIAPRDGVLNIWVAPASDPAAAKPLTTEGKRPIREYFWAPDSSRILFINDKGGDENFLLYGVDLRSGVQTALTPFDKTRVEIVGISRKIKDRILIGVNNRDPRWHDVYSLDLETGKLTLVMKNDGYAGFQTDEDLNLRVAVKASDDGGQQFFRMSGTTVEAKPYTTIGLEDSLTTTPLIFTRDGKTLYWVDSRGRDTAALLAVDVASGKSTVIGEDKRADIGADTVTVSPVTGKVDAYEVNYLKSEWHGIDPGVGADLAYLEKTLKGDINIVSRTDKDDRWTINLERSGAPITTWLFDRATRKTTKMFDTRPELAGAPLVAMHGREIKARDGLTLVSFLSLPPGSDTKGDGIPDKPVPMVLYVHGGPWARDYAGFNRAHQWLANRGYAVLSVNYRGSTGFGKAFTSAGDKQWGRKMHDDLLDAVDWAVKSGVTTRDKVAIMGGSYGGYATLAGMAFTPTTFACGVDIVGPSNLFTLLQTIPPYWEAGKQQFYQRMGNPTTEDGRALLKERSPLFAADRIQRPLLIGQGANDPRVNVRESDQIVAAMAAKNIPVSYIVFPDEGHGFARPQNNIAFNAVAENFLGKCLGGRAEPIGGDLKASTAQVKHGAEFTPGLKEASAPAGQ